MDNDRGGWPCEAASPGGQSGADVGVEVRGQAGAAGRRIGADAPPVSPGGGTVPSREGASSVKGARLWQDDVLAMIARLGPLADRIQEDRRVLQALYPEFDAERDTRLRMLSRLYYAGSSLMFCLSFARDQLSSDRWWDESEGGNSPGEDRRKSAGEFVRFSEAGYLHALFVVVESSLRSIVRAIDPSACEGGRSDFRHIYCHLMNTILVHPPAEGVVLLDLLRLVKNSVHHNGVHQSRRGGDSVLVWRGTTYLFKDGRSVAFLTMDLVFEIADAIRVLLRQVAEDPSVRAVRGEIRDPD